MSFPIFRAGAERSWLALRVTVIIGLVSFLAGLANSGVLADGDTYAQLAIGRWILAHHAVPATEVFSHSASGQPWTVHAWLADVILAAVHGWAGWLGVRVLAAAALAVTMMILTQFLARRLPASFAVGGAVLALVLLLSHFEARPYLLAWPLMAVWLASLLDALDSDQAPSRWLLFVVPLWTNLGISFALGVALAFLLAMEAVFQRQGSIGKTGRTRWLVFIGLSVALALINPRGFKVFSIPGDILHMSTLIPIAEWRSANFHVFQPAMLWIVVVFGLALRGLLPLGLPRLLAAMFLFGLALKSAGNQAILGLTTPFIFAAPLAVAWHERAQQDVRLHSVWERGAALMHPAGSAWIGAGIALGALAVAFFGRLSPPKPSALVSPASALAAARNYGVHGNVLNVYDFAGYLMFEGVPVMVDDRVGAYPDSVFISARDALTLKKTGALDSLLKNFRIEWTILTPRTPATELLNHMPEWRRVYADSVAVVHVRTARLTGSSQ